MARRSLPHAGTPGSAPAVARTERAPDTSLLPPPGNARSAGALAWLMLGSCLAVVAALYGPLLSSPFVGEDLVSVARAHRLLESGWGAVLEILAPRGERPDGLFYRPVHDAWLLLDFALWRFDPRGYHATNLLLLVLTATLLGRLTWQLGAPRVTALLAGLLACIHPCLVEPGAWISARQELAAAVFLLASLALCRGRSTPARSAGAAVCYGLALLSKEWAGIGCILLPAMALVSTDPGGGRPRWRRVAAWSLAITVAWLAVRRLTLGTWLSSYTESPFDPTSAAGWRATATRLTALLVPMPADVFGKPVRIAVAACSLALVVAALARRRVALPAVAWCGLCVAVHWPLRVWTDTLMDARYVAAAALGAVVLLAVGATMVPSRRWRLLGSAALCGVGVAYLVAGQDLRARWRDAAADAPALLRELQRVAGEPRQARVIVHHVPRTIRGARFVLGAEKLVLRPPFTTGVAEGSIVVLQQPEYTWALYTLHSLVEEAASGERLERLAWDRRLQRIVGPWPERGAAEPSADSTPLTQVTLVPGARLRVTMVGPPGAGVQLLGGTIPAAIPLGGTHPLAMRNPVPVRFYVLDGEGRAEDELALPDAGAIVQACTVSADGERVDFSAPWRR